ncbi:MAG: hypothetical protein PF904_19100 [Kiritimatiellae bacterium]|jgi:hypothetical protein|nr:hypothetical protein [Kiritimatiellia bacterium]
MKRGPLYATLTKAALHRRLSLTLRMLLLAGAGLLAAGSLVLIADNLFNLTAITRAVIATLFVAVVLSGLTRLFYLYWRTPIDSAKMAVYLEQRYGIEDNRLINAVHFDRSTGIPGYLKEMFVNSAESACKGLNIRRVWQHARLKPAAIWCAGGLLLFLAYVIPFAPHARNAFLRFLHPSTSVMPLNFTQFNILPGDTEVIEGTPCLISATANKLGHNASALEILIKEDGAPLLYPMRNSADGFVFELRDLSHTTRYAVRNGNDQSRWHTVSVINRPRMDGLTLTVTPPEYTGDDPWTIGPHKREVEVLKGSQVAVRSGASRKQAVTFFQDNVAMTNASEELSFEMSSDTTLSLDVKDARDLMHTDVWRCRLKATDDLIPEVRFLNRELNVQALIGQSIPLSLEERDDFGITALELFVVFNNEEKILKRIHYRSIKRDRMEAAAFSVDEGIFARNASYKVLARVYDTHEPAQQGVVLTPLTLHIVDPSKEMMTGDKDDPYVRLFSLLTVALDEQKSLRDWVAARIEKDRKERISAVIQKRQQSVHNRIVVGANLAGDLYGKKKIRKSLNDSIIELKTMRSAPLILRLPMVAKLEEEPRQAELNDIVIKQSDIVIALQHILGAVSSDKSLKDLKDQQMAEEEQDQKLFDKLKALKKDVHEFREDQRKILSDTEAIDKKEPEDWTEADEKLLGDLAAKEQEYAKFFQAAFNDLSKLENQDFSNSTMADEFVEMIEELQKAGAALEKKHIEIATVNEELLGEQAESIETNLERWLSDASDYIKWNGEEAGIMPDVPLQDLPDELFDIIGELIDDVSDMEDVEDSTGSSLSAFDKGIGWGVSDGNMDDMSAKGITGNVMPNNNEVGGRSGEGRSGKSSGQFVEKEAHGKGGRDTPTRLVQSPFEKGTVIDTSTDPQGGATGGGKQSGVGGEGLRGITPDRKPDVEQRLPGKQAELKQKAEALLRELNVRNLPTGDLEEAVNKMEQIQKYRSTGNGLRVRQVQSELASNLKDARTVLKSGAVGGVEKSEARSLRVSNIRHPDNESTPDGYEESVDAYFRALAE